MPTPDMLEVSVAANVHEVCYHGALDGHLRELGGYRAWECHHHHGWGDAGRTAALKCAERELNRLRKAHNGG